MKKQLLTSLATGLLLVGMSGFASAETYGFDTNPTTGDLITFDGALYWNDVGGGHASIGNYFTGGSILFAEPTQVVGFDLNALPWEGFTPSSLQNMKIGDVTIRAYDDEDDMLWSTDVNLTGYDTWDNWLNVSVGTDELISKITLIPEHTGSIGDSHSGFWPSIDNLEYDTASPVPEPATMLFVGAGLIGLAGTVRRKNR